MRRFTHRPPASTLALAAAQHPEQVHAGHAPRRPRRGRPRPGARLRLCVFTDGLQVLHRACSAVLCALPPQAPPAPHPRPRAETTATSATPSSTWRHLPRCGRSLTRGTGGRGRASTRRRRARSRGRASRARRRSPRDSPRRRRSSTRPSSTAPCSSCGRGRRRSSSRRREEGGRRRSDSRERSSCRCVLRVCKFRRLELEQWRLLLVYYSVRGSRLDTCGCGSCGTCTPLSPLSPNATI